MSFNPNRVQVGGARLDLGSIENFQVTSGTGNDTFRGGGANDLFSGGGGIDTSVYALASTSATWVRNLDGSWTVSAGAEGTDTVTSVEFLDFTDRDVFLDTAEATFFGDGASDLYWRRSDGLTVIWNMNGAAVLANGLTSLQVGNEWQIAAIGDYNGDGRDDLLWRNANGLSVVWAMNGANVVSSTLTQLQVDNDWTLIGG